VRPFVLLIALAVAVPVASSQTAPARNALRGAIDIHVHALPDSRSRSLDGIEAARFADDRRPFVSVSGNGGVPLPAVKDVIALVAKHNLVLATGHSSAEEVLMLLREGQRQGVRHMMVTHAMNPPILMDVLQMQEAAGLGAFIEFVGSSLETPDAPARMDRFADAIRKIGPQFCILSSDLGQKDNPLPAEGYAAFLAAMRARGFSEADVDLMSKRNPALLLGLP